MPDNTTLNQGTGGDTIRDLARQAGTVKTQTFQLDLGGVTGNAEVLITAGQQLMAASVPVALASNQTALAVSNAGTFAVQSAATLAAETTKVIGTVNQAALTKGTQGAAGLSTQDLKDAGRNNSNWFMVLPVLSTATETLAALTGYKSGASVAATTTPPVVSAGKTFRINAITISYVAIAGTTAGSARFSLRVLAGGVVTVASPVVQTFVLGSPAAVAGVAQTLEIAFPDGLEIPAGAGFGCSLLGLSATQVASAVGYGLISLNGFEY